jgi:hypothetical protein
LEPKLGTISNYQTVSEEEFSEVRIELRTVASCSHEKH